ncbi:hypothetical protein [Hymenobacter properus]|uniref:Uncharacterized protein n=1 Tax=Hymenobacter properus TaxID=2791026 RepID=A0A931BJF8_9BACT|nr:hypothetical protein [Hymenobacter properus]MBF9143393.1 hypothetical protein [Hymenobacter properus]MBR7722206.1 hypothetical protein [Microvirga sp. SRT04]
MKVLFKVLLAIFALFVLAGIGGYFYFRQQFQAPANQLTVSQLPATTRFAWRADTTATRITPHAVLLVPILLPNCPRTCYLQFDTGAPYTLLYSHALAALQASYPAASPALKPQAGALQNFPFTIGQGQVAARTIRVREMGARTLPADSTAPFVIGTLGTDLLEGRVLVIDYARQRFELRTDVPDSLARRAVFAPLAFEQRRVLLSAGLQGTDKQLLFDSGSSAFALLTSQASWQELAQPGAPDQVTPVNSWGKTLTAHTAPTAARLQIGATALPLGTVTYIDGTTFMQRTLMRFSGMGGMLGNKVFSQHTLILDVKGGRFGVVVAPRR